MESSSPELDVWMKGQASPNGRPVLLRVDYEAGHGWGSTRSVEADELADEYAFLFSQLGAARAGL